MPSSSRSTRRAISLGVILSLVFLGLSLSRPATKAQEPAKVPDKKSLRERILALHVEIDLIEIEQEADRQTLLDMSKEERKFDARFEFDFGTNGGVLKTEVTEQFYSLGGDIALMLGSKKSFDDDKLREILLETTRDTESKNKIIELFGGEIFQGLQSLTKIEKKDEFSLARERLGERILEVILNKMKEPIRRKADPIRNVFSRRSAELAGKKLDLADFERQYQEAR